MNGPSNERTPSFDAAAGAGDSGKGEPQNTIDWRSTAGEVEGEGEGEERALAGVALLRPKSARVVRPARHLRDDPPDSIPQKRDELAGAVRSGLSGPGPKTLSAWLLYDDAGSALFDVISLLPDYGLTRADERILRRHATAIVSSLPPAPLVIELGCGSGGKTRWILEATAARGRSRYVPIDISRTALERCAAEMGRIAGVTVEPVAADFLSGLRTAVGKRRSGAPLLVLFLGSTIGNLDRPAAGKLLREVRLALRPGDAFLLGTDLVKPAQRLLAAYDDPLGVTAAFNRNLLVRINRELGATFDLAAFSHEARWNERERRVEMHLRSQRRQAVSISALSLVVRFRAGETIWTESSYKYEPGEVAAMSGKAGFVPAGAWCDAEWPFSEDLLVAR